MSHNVDDSSLREGSDTHGSAHVVSEDEEGGAVRDEASSVEGNTVADGSHSVLADSEAEVALSVLSLLEVTEHLHEGEVGGGKISRASDETREGRGEGVEHRLRVLAGGEGLVLRLEGGEGLLPALRELAADESLVLCPLLGVLLGIDLAALLPLLLIRSSTSDGSTENIVDILGDLKLTIVPLEVLASGSSLLCTEGSSVDIMGVSLVGGSIANEGRDLDEGGLVGDRLCLSDGLADGFVVGVSVLDVDHVPSESLVPLGDVLSKGDLGVSINGDLVVVVEGDELAKAPVAGEGAGLVRDTLHHASVSEDAVGVVVDNLGCIRLVEASSKMGLCDCDTDGIADSSSEGSYSRLMGAVIRRCDGVAREDRLTRGDFDSLGDEVLGMSRSL